MPSSSRPPRPRAAAKAEPQPADPQPDDPEAAERRRLDQLEDLELLEEARRRGVDFTGRTVTRDQVIDAAVAAAPNDPAGQQPAAP